MSTSNLNNYYFNLLRESSERQLELLETYKSVNEFLRQNAWLFVCPLFFQGIHLEYFFKLRSQPDAKQKILKLIKGRFYHLNWTTTFIDGLCVRCNYINPFLRSIEHGVILAFQKDYEGSIKTIIPIIEGVIRKYLVSEKGYNNSNIDFRKIKSSLNLLEKDIIENEREKYRYFESENKVKVEFTSEQIETLIKLDTSYYSVWFSFITDFFENSFYLSTQSKDITNEVNRHSILHELGFDFSYNFENFIKIFFVILFLTWIFLIKEGKSQMTEIDSQTFLNKMISYKNIIEKSRQLDYDKHVLLSNKRGYDEEILKDEMIPTIDLNFKPKHWLFIRFDRWVKEQKWKREKVNR